jgi:hypothetical protein
MGWKGNEGTAIICHKKAKTENCSTEAYICREVKMRDAVRSSWILMQFSMYPCLSVPLYPLYP